MNLILRFGKSRAEREEIVQRTILVKEPESEVSKVFLEIAAKLAGQLSVVSENVSRAQSMRIVSS